MVAPLDGGESATDRRRSTAFVHGLAVVMGIGAAIDLVGIVVARRFFPRGAISVEPSPTPDSPPGSPPDGSDSGSADGSDPALR